MILKNNIVIGAGGHSRPVVETLYLLKKKKIKIFDTSYSKNKNNIILKSTVAGDFKKINLKKYIKNNFYLAIGDNKIRKNFFNKLNKKVDLPNLISPYAYVSKFSQIGLANFLNHYSYIGPNSSLGNNNIINTHVLIEHDVKIGNNTHICPCVKIAGSSSIGDNVFVGIGSIIIDKIKISSNVTIGAGSIVRENINYPGKYIVVNGKLKKL
jgi:sugar O-acyltransferase (sialic acid O-acetyltransferase NeuD family)